jgi:NMD protein affecting ribosome stability and mRNA decay
MTGVNHKIAREEKGQRTARSTSVYLPKKGGKEAALCRKCGAFYLNKRWSINPAEVKDVKGESGLNKIVCPACRRMEDDNPAGIVTLSGSYLVAHEREFLDAISHIEAKSRQKNPLGRIMAISQEKDTITIATTEEKLAQKLGREIYKAHKGELHYQWSHDQELVRVKWTR